MGFSIFNTTFIEVKQTEKTDVVRLRSVRLEEKKNPWCILLMPFSVLVFKKGISRSLDHRIKTTAGCFFKGCK